ncbi:MAG: DnaJ domain-containing protein [Chloroherpetonaceae bacterium]
MGQILNRLKDLVNSEVNSKKSSGIDDDQAIDLEKIIQELKSSQTDSKFDDRTDESDYKNDSSTRVFTVSQALKILELPENATNEMIKSAYKQRMMEYHPDKVNNLGKELQNLAENKTKEINEAYEFLKKIKNIR